jgi:hypothetical protein
MELNNTFYVDINSCKSIGNYTNIDLSLRNTKIYISTSTYPSLRMGLICEQLDPSMEDFICSRELETGSGIVAGVIFNNDKTNIINSYRTIILCFNPKLLHDESTYDMLRGEIEYITAEARFLSNDIALELNELIYDRVKFFTEISATTAPTFKDEHFNESVLSEQESHLITTASKDGWTNMFHTLTLALIYKYDNLSYDSMENFKDVDVYEITMDTVTEVELFNMQGAEQHGQLINEQPTQQPNHNLNTDDAFNNNGFSIN